MDQPGQFWVFNIFILICTPVQSSCSQRTFQFLSLPLLCPSPGLCTASHQGCRLLTDAWGGGGCWGVGRGNISLQHPLLRARLIWTARSRSALGMSHRYLALTLFKSKLIFPSLPVPTPEMAPLSTKLGKPEMEHLPCLLSLPHPQ